MSTATATPPTASAMFDWVEFARRIGQKPDWVRRHIADLPHHRTPSGRVRFSDRCVEQYLDQTYVAPGADLRGTPRSQAHRRNRGAK